MYDTFAVDFSDPNDDPEYEDENGNIVHHGYRASILVNLPDTDFIRITETDPRIDQLEHDYGILDISDTRDTNIDSIGYNSYEIEMKDAPVVFDKLCDIFRSWITGPKTEEFYTEIEPA